MKLSLGAKTAIGVAVLLAAMLSSAFLTITLREHQTTSRTDLIRTYRILHQLELVLSTVKDAETGQRGFLLTGDRSYLAPFQTSVVTVRGVLADLNDLMSQPEHQSKLSALANKIDKKLAELNATVNLRTSGKADQAIKLVRSNTGKRTMDDIRKIIADLQSSESELLQHRTVELDLLTSTCAAASLGFIGISLVSILFTGLLLHLFLAERRLAEIKLSERSLELEKNQRELADFFDDALEGLQWISDKGIIVRANKAELTLLGYQADEYVGRHFADFHENRAMAENMIEKLTKREQLHNYPASLRCKDGSIKHVEIDATVYCQNDVVVHSRCFTRDVTAQRKAESELREREARTRAILDTAPDGIVILDEDGNVELANRATAAIFERDRIDLMGMHVSELIPNFISATDDFEQELLTTGSNKVFGVVREYIAKKKDNSSLPVELAWSVLNLGERAVFTLVIRDVTKRKNTEVKVALQHSVTNCINAATSLTEITSKILQSICEKMGFAIGEFWQVNEAQNVLYCSDLWHTPKFEGSSFIDTTKSTTFSSGSGLPGRVWEMGAPVWITELKQDDNFPRAAVADAAGIVTGFASPITYGGTVPGVLCFYTDERRSPDGSLLQLMTSIGIQIGQFMQRTRTEETSNRQRLLLELMLETMSDGVVVADKQGRFVIVNREAEEMFGELIDMDPAKWSEYYGVFLPDESSSFPAGDLPLAQALRGISTNDVELFVKQSRGGCYISVTGRPVTGQLFDGGMVVCRDVTEKKLAEKRVSEFYSTVSHELRTPLTSIRGSLGLIDGGLAGEVSPKCKKLVGIAVSESDRLIRLINDILDIRKIEAGMLELKLANVKASHLIERTIEGIRGLSQEAAVLILPQIESDGMIECDEDRIIQVLTNLVSNAIKFSKSHDTVIVRVSPVGTNSLRFAVIDTGPGIPPEHLHKLFGKFQQIDQSDRRQKGGSGLGLAVSKAIVEQHQGKMGVNSQFGSGSTFWFELLTPVICAPLEITECVQAKHPALIVEDDNYIAEILADHLVNNGFTVVRAGTLAEARAILAQTCPLVVVLDLKLPDGNGLDLLRELSNDATKNNIPVVIVTAAEQRTAPAASMYPTLIQWIAKPFKGEQIDGALELAREQMGPARVLIVEDDVATRAVLKEQLEVLGISCIEANDGMEAVNLFRQENPDLIILDLKIPALDGFAVIEILRRESNAMKPLIVYTASDLTEEQKSHLKLGLTAHLTKGTTTQDQLLTTVRDFLDGLLLGKAKHG